MFTERAGFRLTLATARRGLKRLYLERADLLKHTHEIEVVPGFNNLAVLNTHDADAGNLDWLLRRRVSNAISLVLASHNATTRNLIAFEHGVFNNHFDVWKSVTKLFMESFETGRAAQRIAAFIRKTMGDPVFGKHFVNRLRTPLVPNLFKPATEQSPVFF
jgi:hypothetical protein